MAQIINKLNLNNNPKEVDNNSLVYAKNIMISKDNTTIVNEDSIYNSDAFTTLNSFYDGKFEINAIFSTNIELIIFSKYTGEDLTIKYHFPDINIFRYDEYTRSCKLFYNKIKYINNDSKLAFNYNHLNQLIICFSSYKEDGLEPIRTLNLGEFSRGYSSLQDYIANDKKTFLDDANICDKHLLYSHTSLMPELKIPKITDFNYIAGKSYKGIYNCFIRYKINNTNYTNWFNIGRPIYMDSLKRYNIIKYNYNHPCNLEEAPELIVQNKNNLGFSLGCSDYFSTEDDYCDNSFELDIDYLDVNFIGFQLGFACLRKDYTKGFITKDIYINESYYTYRFNADELLEHDVNDFIIKYNNYYNVKNLINYKNKIYFSNYKEDNLNKNIKLSDDDFKLNININDYYLKEVINKTIFNNGIFSNSDINNTLQSDLNIYDKNISIKEFFNIKDNKIKITGGIEENTKYKYYAQIYITANYIYNKKIYSYAGYMKVYNNDGGNANQNYSYDDQYLYKLDENGSPVQKNQLGITFYDYVDGVKTKNRLYVSKNYFEYSDRSGNTDRISLYGPDSEEYIVSSVKVKYDKYLSKEIISGDTGSDYYLTNDDYIYIDSNTNKFKIHINGKEYDDITITADGKDYTLNNDSFYCYYNSYINSKKVFENIKDNYLIPGNIYGFYIHYVDKYGNYTNGINIPYNKKYISDGNITLDVTKLNLIYIKEEQLKIYVAIVDPLKQIKVNYGYNIDYIAIYNTEDRTYSDITLIDHNNYDPNSKYAEFFNNNYYIYDDIVKWQDTHLVAYSDYEECLPKYITDENLCYYKIPINEHLYKLNLEINNIPEGYVGYFITADIHKTVKYKGIVALEDANSWFVKPWTDSITSETNKLNSYNTNINNTIARFFSDELDINDELPTDIKYLAYFTPNIIYGSTRLNNYFLNNSHYLTTLNNHIPLGDESTVSVIKLENVTFNEAYSNINNAFNIGSHISFNNTYKNKEIKNCFIFTDNVDIKKDKTLVRISEIEYLLGNVNVYHDGYFTTQGILIYNKNGVVLKDSTKILYSNTDQTYINKDGSNKEAQDIDKNNLYDYFILYTQTLILDDYLHESKQFKNKPESIIKSIYNKVNSETDIININSYGCFVTPANSKDLFQRKSLSFVEGNLITYDNYSKEYIYSEEFNKTIRRSFQIKDESVTNNWRQIDNESYKNITENKGNITNIIGIGNKFLIHTEHSLFQLDADNVLQTNNKDVLLEDKDIFDVQYKELFSSVFGYGGLQNNKSFIVGSFGYIWYDSDSRHIYRLDDRGFNIIDNDITNFINKYVKISNIVFADDIKNNRIIMQITIGVMINITLSYNYAINSFISFHDYIFDKYINTKNNIYFIIKKHIYEFSDVSKNTYPDHLNSFIKYPVKISFIVNNDYDIIKYIEYIKYRIKYVNDDSVGSDYSPVEKEDINYAGDLIRVYNNLVDTENIDITITESDKNKPANDSKPYWELGYWNFNYLRNKIENSNISNVDKSRIFGNFFIIEFTFNVNEYNFKFESLDVKYKLD